MFGLLKNTRKRHWKIIFQCLFRVFFFKRSVEWNKNCLLFRNININIFSIIIYYNIYFKKEKKTKMGKKKLLRHLSYLSKSHLNLSEKLMPSDVIKTPPSSPLTSLAPSQGLLARTWKTSLRVCLYTIYWVIIDIVLNSRLELIVYIFIQFI